MNQVAPILLPFFFVGIWLLAIGLLAAVGGWRSLAASYAAPEGFEPEPENRYRFRSIQLRSGFLLRSNYRGSMTVGLTSQGLYLVPFVLFRFLHKPLLIPWTAITDCDEGSFLWMQWIDMTVRDRPVIRVYGAVGDAAWGQWRSTVRK